MATAPALIEDEGYPDDFIAFLREEEMRAVDSELNAEREAALDFYNGEPFGNEEDGRSQVVTRDVAEVVDYMTVSVLRTMVSGDRVVEFEADDDDMAAEATYVISRQFMTKQRGYQVLHDSLKAGLLEKTGVIKTFVEEQPPKRKVVELPAEGLAMLAEQGIQPIEAEALDEAETAWRVAYLEPQPPRFVDVAVPNEELLVSGDARDLADGFYVAHKTPKTISQVREMGFDVDDDIGGGDSGPDDNLAQARDSDSRWDGSERSGAARKVWLLEEYVRYDLNGDGVLESLCVHRVGNTILSVEEVDEHTLEDWCPFPMPHRRVGQSLADKCVDIQLVRSILLRQALDNSYLANAPRMLVHEQGMSDNTIDDLLTVRPGGLIRWAGTNEPKPLVTPFVADSAFKAMEVLSGEKETRTGITRLNQGLDADTLNKTATGTALMQAQGQQIEEYIARNFAEFIGRVFLKRYRLMRRHGKPFPMKIDGEMRMVDPSKWPEDVDVMVRVGLGSGRKEQRLQYRMMLLETQKEALAIGSPLVDDDKMFNSLKGLVADANLGNINDFFVDPATLQQTDEQGNPVPKPEKPDPELVKAQAETQIKAAELQGKQEEAANNLELSRQKAVAEIEMQREKNAAAIEMEREKAAQAAQLARDRAQEESILAREKFAFEMQMARDQQAIDAEMARENARLNAEAKREAQSLPKNRPGGDLDK